METFSKIRHLSRLSDEVYDQILQAVLNRTLDPHQRIIQEDLADRMEVSRTPVRDALLRLEGEGVLMRVGRSGFKLREYTDDEVRQLYQAREAVECYALGWLSQNAQADEIDRLKSVVEKIEGDVQKSLMDYFKANLAIHREFVLATDNAVLVEMFDGIWNRSRSYFLFAEFSPTDLEKSLEGHLELCDVLRSKDEQLAIQRMRNHIQDGLELQRGALEKPNRELVEQSETVDLD